MSEANKTVDCLFNALRWALPPCRACGGDPYVSTGGPDPYRYSVICQTCGLSTPQFQVIDLDVMAKGWSYGNHYSGTRR